MLNSKNRLKEVPKYLSINDNMNSRKNQSWGKINGELKEIILYGNLEHSTDYDHDSIRRCESTR